MNTKIENEMRAQAVRAYEDRQSSEPGAYVELVWAAMERATCDDEFPVELTAGEERDAVTMALKATIDGYAGWHRQGLTADQQRLATAIYEELEANAVYAVTGRITKY